MSDILVSNETKISRSFFTLKKLSLKTKFPTERERIVSPDPGLPPDGIKPSISVFLC